MPNYRRSAKQWVALISFTVLIPLCFVLGAFAQSPITGVVLKNANLRVGPGLNFAIVGAAQSGQPVTIIGKNAAGTWVQLDTGQWIAAFLVKTPDLLTTATEIAPTSTSTTPTSIATATPLSTAMPEPTTTPSAAQAKLPANQGCYLFQNYLGAELTVTLTGQDSHKAITFKVPASQEVPVCLDPGAYTYTLDAPPPWNSINGGLDAKAGKYYFFPVEGRK